MWDDSADLWEHQGEDLTVSQMKKALELADGELLVRIAVYQGGAPISLSTPIEIGFVGEGRTPSYVVITTATI